MVFNVHHNHFKIHTDLHNIILCNVTLSLISPNPREWMCLVKIFLHVVTLSSHISQVYFIKAIHLTTHSHTSSCHHCHYYKVDFMLFQNVARYTASLFSCIRVNITYLFNITCTLIATYIVLERSECKKLVWSLHMCFELFESWPPNLVGWHTHV